MLELIVVSIMSWSTAFRLCYTSLTVDNIVDGRSLNNETRCQLQPKKTKVTLGCYTIGKIKER